MNNWNIDSWRSHQVKHIPVYPDQGKLKEVENTLKGFSSFGICWRSTFFKK